MTILHWPQVILVETYDNHYIIGHTTRVKGMVDEGQMKIRRVLLCEWTQKESDRALARMPYIAEFLRDKMDNNPLHTEPN